MAAVLWGGRDAVVSHETAAALWHLHRPEPLLHVTVSRKPGPPPPGVRVHERKALARRDCGRLRGIQITGVARTLLDLAGDLPEDRLLRLVERAVLDGLVTAESIHDVVERNRGRRGSRRLARALDTAGSSALVRRVEAILRDAGLPAHRREYAVGRFRLDFAWPGDRVAIEADGRRWHSAAADFERDRAKANYLTERGWSVLRVTWSDLEDPGPWLGVTARLLGR